jgi:hypothetical protein
MRGELYQSCSGARDGLRNSGHRTLAPGPIECGLGVLFNFFNFAEGTRGDPVARPF